MYRIVGALAVLTAIGALVAAHPFSSTSTSSFARRAPAPIVATATDGPAIAWPIFAPERAPRAGKRPAQRPERSPAPDWKGLSLSVAETGAPATAQASLASVDHYADLKVSMSRDERRVLMAQAREPDVSVAPPGYRPGIVVINPGGMSGDGICR